MKRTLSIIGIGAAFLAVSLWVWFTNGKSSKAVMAKFRLGGALLTLTSALTLGSCGGRPVITCYDTPSMNEVLIECDRTRESIEVRNGDKITIGVSYFNAYGIRVSIVKGEDPSGNAEVLQSTVYEITGQDASVTHTVNAGSYTGQAQILVYMLSSADDEGYVCEYYKLNVIG
jgi:hypothetical protein